MDLYMLTGQCHSIQSGLDETDACVDSKSQDEVEEKPSCYYLVVISREQLLINVTPQAVSVLTHMMQVHILMNHLNIVQWT